MFTLGPTLSVVVFRVGYDFVNLMAADHSRLAYKAVPTDLEGQAGVDFCQRVVIGFVACGIPGAEQPMIDSA